MNHITHKRSSVRPWAWFCLVFWLAAIAWMVSGCSEGRPLRDDWCLQNDVDVEMVRRCDALESKGFWQRCQSANAVASAEIESRAMCDRSQK